MYENIEGYADPTAKTEGGVFTVYAHLKELRESLGMTQEEFGKSIGIAKSTYNNYEKGIRDPKSDFWIAVAKKYGVTIDYLMGYSDDPHRITSRSTTFTGLKLSKAGRSGSARRNASRAIGDLVPIIRQTAALASFEIVGRITFRDKTTGKEYRTRICKCRRVHHEMRPTIRADTQRDNAVM